MYLVTPVGHAPGMAWNPWRALRNLPQVDVVRRHLSHGRGLLGMDAEVAVVVLDDRLGQVERNAVLAHELVHYERGGGAHYVGQPDTWDAVVARDEAAVDNEVARRLVPPDELAAWVAARVEMGECVMAWEIAEEWTVPERVARRAKPS